jgi:hypothetical protein
VESRLLVVSLNLIVVSSLFYGFLSVIAWFVALFFTVLRICFVVYCRLPCGFVAGKLLQLAVLLGKFSSSVCLRLVYRKFTRRWVWS